MLLIEDNTITLTRGDSAALTFDLTQANDSVYEMGEGDKLRLTVRKRAESSSPVLLEAESDTDHFHLTPSETRALPIGKLSYDVQLETAAGDVFTIVGAESTNTFLKNFIVLPEVTE